VGLALLVPLAAFQPVAPAGAPAATAKHERMIAPAGAAAAASEVSVAENEWTWTGSIRDGGLVEVYALNGGITIERGSGSRVSVRAVPGRLRDDNPRLMVTEGRDQITVCILHGNQTACEAGRGPRGRTGTSNNSDVNVTVTMPAGARLAARTTNGAIESQLMAAEIDAQTTNGSVNVSSSRGDVSARTTNGAVRVGASGRVTAQTTNGSVHALLAETGWRGESRLATTNGSITIELPAAANVDIEARTRSGRISSHFALDIRTPRGSGASASGRIGRGGRSLTASTTNGSIVINEAGRAASRGSVEHDAAEIGVAAAQAALTAAEATTAAVLDSGVIEAALASVMEGLDASRIMDEVRLAIDSEDVRRALEEARRELASIDHSAIRNEALRAMEEARRELESIDHEAIRADVYRSLEETRLEMDAIDYDAIREETRLALEEAQRELEQARLEMEEARRERERSRQSQDN
jgi:hypothetical protein